VPAVVDTLNSNADQGLVLISLQGQNQRDDVADDHWLKVGQDMGMEHALGETSYFGEYSPYFNLNDNTSTTYAFIIGRSGVVRWHGDLGSKEEEYYLALAEALAVPDVPAVEPGEAPELSKSLLQFVEGDLGKAAKEASKVRSKNAKLSKAEAQATAAKASKIVDSLVAYESSLMDAARKGLEESNAEGYTRATRALLATFPKTPHKKELKQLGKQLKTNKDLALEVNAWGSWLDLVHERPVTFPARESRENGRYAKKLKRHMETPSAPGLSMAQGWLTRWEARP
jgi:hypothetical protein